MPALPVRRLTALLASGVLATTGAVALAAPATAASPDVVISQVYGGGGNSGARLHPRLHRAAEPRHRRRRRHRLERAVRVVDRRELPGHPPDRHRSRRAAYYLVQEAPGAGGTTPLPTPDATGTIAMSGTAGKVALVTSADRADLRPPTATTPRACGTSSATARRQRLRGHRRRAGACPTPRRPCAATGPDTDNNAADFTAGRREPPQQRRRRRPGPGPRPEPAPAARIHEIQGGAHRSPLTGKAGRQRPRRRHRGRRQRLLVPGPGAGRQPGDQRGPVRLHLHRARGEVGDAVTVQGTVTEFRPGGTATQPHHHRAHQGRPSRSPPRAWPCRRRLWSAPAGGRRRPRSARTRPVTSRPPARRSTRPPNALDFYESLEGMHLRVKDARGHRADGELRRDLGAARRRRHPAHRARRRPLHATPTATPSGSSSTTCWPSCPPANVGDVLPGNIVGVLDYGFGNFKLEVLATPTAVSQRPAAGDHPQAVPVRARGRHVQRGEPRPDRPGREVRRRSRDHRREEPGLAGRRWRWRRSRTTTAPPTTARSRPTRRTPSSSPRSSRPAARRTSTARSTRATRRTAASRAATSGSASCSTDSGSRSWTGPAAAPTSRPAW